MNVPELITAYAEYNELSLIMMGTLITLVSAYLVATFLAASRLSWFQFGFVSIAFVLVSVDLVFGMYFHWEMSISIHNELMQRVNETDSPVGFLFAPEGSRTADGPLILWLLGVVSSVAFSAHNKFRGDA
jgi:hypothetical protein